MNKMNISLTSDTTRIVKYNGKKIEVRSRIGTIEQMQILDVCLQQFNKDNKSLPIIRAIFNVAVLSLQTNIYVPEVSKTINGDDFLINVDIDSGIIEYYENSNIYDCVFKEIINLNESWDIVVKSIELYNTRNAFASVVENLPSETAMNDSITMISKLIKENPDFTKGLIKEQMKSKVVEAGVKEFNDKIEDVKLDNLAKKNVDKMIAEEKVKLKNKKK